MSKISREKKRARLERKVQAADIAAAFLGKKKHLALEKIRTEMAALDARRAKRRFYTAMGRPGEFEKAISAMCQLLDKQAAIEAFLGLFRLAPTRYHAIALAKKLRGASMAEAIFAYVTTHWSERRRPSRESLLTETPCSCDLCVPEIRAALEAELQRWYKSYRGKLWEDIRRGR